MTEIFGYIARDISHYGINFDGQQFGCSARRIIPVLENGEIAGKCCSEFYTRDKRCSRTHDHVYPFALSASPSDVPCMSHLSKVQVITERDRLHEAEYAVIKDS